MRRNTSALKVRSNQSSEGALGSKKEPKKEPHKIKKPGHKSFKRHKDLHQLYYPDAKVAFRAILLARLLSAVWRCIDNSEETFRFWEPLHYLIYGKGFKPFTYEPNYATESYAYLVLYAIPGFIFRTVRFDPASVFYLLRCCLAIGSAKAETYFYKGICREFGVNIGRITLAFLIFSPGMFAASTALTPDGFVMHTTTIACAFWWTEKCKVALFFFILGAHIGNPLSALLCIPLIYDIIFIRKSYKSFIKWILISVILVTIPVVSIDSFFYGKLTFVPSNAIQSMEFVQIANVLDSNRFSYYAINGFTNFNLIWIFAVLNPAFLLIQYFFVPAKYKLTLLLPHYVSLGPCLIWLMVLKFRVEENECFMYPIYPLICLCGAITIDAAQKLSFRVTHLLKLVNPPTTHYLEFTRHIMMFAVVTSAILSVSRVTSMVYNHHAMFDIVRNLNAREHVENDAICYGTEWKRFPTSYFFHGYDVKFIENDLNDVMPDYYVNGATHKYYDRENKKHIYFDVRNCQYIIDFIAADSTSIRNDILTRDRTQWKVIKTFPFLHSTKSDAFFQTFYVPYLNNAFVSYGNYTLLRKFS